MPQCLVPGRGEIVNPDEIEHPGPEFPRDLLGPVRTARVNDDDLVENPCHRLQTVRQIVFLVADDHGQAHPRRRSGRAMFHQFIRVRRTDTERASGRAAVTPAPAVPIRARRASEGSGCAARTGHRPSLARRAGMGLGRAWPGRDPTVTFIRFAPAP